MCLLVIDGAPEVHGLIERVEMAAIDGTKPQLLRQIQRMIKVWARRAIQ